MNLKNSIGVVTRSAKKSKFLELSKSGLVVEILHWDFGKAQQLPEHGAYLVDISDPECVRQIAQQIRGTPNSEIASAAVIWLTKEFISMFTSEKREKRARRGERAKSPQGYLTIPRGLLASSPKHGEAYRASQREDTYKLLSKSRVVSAWPSLLLDDVMESVTGDTAIARIHARIEQAGLRCQSAQKALENARSETILKQREEFLGICTHDLRSPIGLVRASLQMALGENNRLSELQTELLTRAERQSVHALTLIEDLLDVMSYDQGLRPEYQVVVLGEYLNAFYQDYRLQADQKKIRFEYHNPIAHWKVLIDPDRVRQMLQNLFTNAVKFTSEGKAISLSVEPFNGRRKMDPPFPMVMLSLKDEGVGICKEELGHIFDRFIQAKGMGRAQGRGLGLSVAKQIAQLHGGNVWVASEPGKGSHFFVMFPHVIGSATAQEKAPCRVLIADPNRQNEDMYQTLLRRPEIDITFAKDGVEAITMAHYLNPKVVLVAPELEKISADTVMKLLCNDAIPNRLLLSPVTCSEVL